jgi:hypothetical protein
MFYKYLADAVMIIHAALIFLILAGILVSIRYKRFRPVESVGLLSAILIWSLYGGCPATYLENYLRILAEHPLPLAEVGFIPFYFAKWFSLPITDYQLTLATYITALVFFLISVEWISPYINIEIFKLRKALGFVKN